MYLLYTDETNMDPAASEFFVYGGLAIDAAKAPALAAAIDELRKSFKIEPLFQLKFNPRPPNLSHGEFKQLKSAILETLAAHGCYLLISSILHNVATSTNDARRKEINRILYHFDCTLNRIDDHGIVLLDRFSDTALDAQVRERVAVGLTGMPYSATMPLHRILGIHYSAIGQSHFCTAIDVALGSLRWAINCFCKEEPLDSANTLLELLNPLFYRHSDSTAIPKLGFCFSPIAITSATYRRRYQELKDFLASAGVETMQPITEHRRY